MTRTFGATIDRRTAKRKTAEGFGYSRNRARETAKPMIPEFSAAVSTLSGSVGLLKTLLNTTRDEAVRTAIFDIQNELLSLQQKLFDANARFDEQSEKVKALQKQLGLKVDDVAGEATQAAVAAELAKLPQ